MRSATRRRVSLAAAAVALVAVAGVCAARRSIAGSAIAGLLARAGAADVKLSVAEVSPWRIIADDVAFTLDARRYSADRVSVQRPHWWTPSLGAVNVERALTQLTIDHSDVDPWNWTAAGGGQEPGGAIALPLDELSIDGRLVIAAAALPGASLEVKMEARQAAGGAWKGSMTAKGDGLSIAADAVFQPAQAFTFHVSTFEMDLAKWQDQIQRVVTLPGGRWELAGAVTATADGRYAGGEWTASGAVSLRDGTMTIPDRNVSARGIGFDVEFEDFNAFRSRPGSFHASELKSGDLKATDLDAGFTLEKAGQLAIDHASLKTLGGTISAEPFRLFLDQREVKAVLRLERLDVAQILALAKDVPAEATGRVDGRLPIEIDDSGLRFGTGWLALSPDVPAELTFEAKGLLTRGANPKSAAYGVLQQVETGLLRLRLSKMRLEVYPPNRPPGRSAQLHLEGDPADPGLKAPVTLDVNVNGPVEKLLNLGLSNRISVSP